MIPAILATAPSERGYRPSSIAPTATGVAEARQTSMSGQRPRPPWRSARWIGAVWRCGTGGGGRFAVSWRAKPGGGGCAVMRAGSQRGRCARVGMDGGTISGRGAGTDDASRSSRGTVREAPPQDAVGGAAGPCRGV